jgi:glucose-6-phosphate 1-dehydrogenase
MKVCVEIRMKVPGAGFKVQEVGMDFHYSALSDTRLPDAYERLLLDCILGDATLYSRGDAVEATWQFIDPILNYWKENPDTKLYGYPAGSWGPNILDSLIEGKEHTWRYPCKNLTADETYCNFVRYEELFQNTGFPGCLHTADRLAMDFIKICRTNTRVS